MKSFVLRRAAFAATPLALACAFPLFAAAQTSQDNSLDEVLVTASRFANDPAFTPIAATVITAAQIREAGADNVNEAIRKIGGVYGRQSLNGTADYSLDLRGFGSSSDQNMVVLIDGIRLSENELTSTLLSSIPVDSVERIEIVRGGSSVLYGEGATGGTIQIITKKAAAGKLRGTALAEAGSYGHREVRASLAGGGNGFSADASVSAQRADNYRANNEVKQKNFSSGVQWASDATRIGARVDVARQDSRLPGSLTLAQFENDPRQTLTPDDFGSVDSNRYTLFVEQHWGGLEAAAELSHRDRTAEAAYAGSFGDYASRADSRVTQFSPRIRHLSASGSINNELVAGLDFQRWTRTTDAASGGFSLTDSDGSQKSRAIYARDEIRVGDARIAAGARHELFDKTFTDPLSFSNTAYDKSDALNAWELQGSYTAMPALDLFAKTGRSYRVANIDENALTPAFNQPLKPQTSRDYELGATFGDKQDKATFKLFRHQLKNEIYYDPTAGAFGANTNLDPTRRQGFEVDAAAHVAQAFALSLHAQHVSAQFVEGANAGREVTLVPRNTATVRLNWLPQDGRSADIGVRWVDEQRYGGDFDNACNARVPAFTTLDGRYAQRFGAWEFAVTGSNLGDRKYFTNAFGACNSGIYPDPGRQLKISARLDF